jgi:hypothetical protein
LREEAEMHATLCRFAESLRGALACASPESFDSLWKASRLDQDGWTALAEARRGTDPALAPVLHEVDRLLLRLLDGVPRVASAGGPAARTLLTFRLPELERLQHAAAAALVAHRCGTAGLAAVADDATAPRARRYYAFIALAELHAEATWPVFRRYLTPRAHHAFVGVAAEAARYYVAPRPAGDLVDLFEAVRRDLPLRAFLSPRILGSLFVLSDPATLPFYRDLLIAGHTDPDPLHCEVTHALVMVRRFTGGVAPSSKFSAVGPRAAKWLDAAERLLEQEQHVLHPVRVL